MPYFLSSNNVSYSNLETTTDDGHSVIICSSDAELAICYDTSSGALHKHGEASKVNEWAVKTRKALADNGFGSFATDISVTIFPVTSETIAELNACISISGRCLGFNEFLNNLLNSDRQLI